MYRASCKCKDEDVQDHVNSFLDIPLKETKRGKTYYRCKFSNRFKCPFKLRIYATTEPGVTQIEVTKSVHDNTNELFERGLFQAVKQAIKTVLESNPR